ncbi:MAG: 5'-methylthioadenosine/adenosylhomocysteine nucleosidase [Treponema sp.]|nr:5'-methylthioadenosine/adenosylhomocysteine nucleosidase [Treponema sp.]
MKIGILGAMEREVKSLYEQLEGMAVKEIGKVKYYCGTLCGKEVVVVQCGVGKVSAAVGAQNLINHFGITHLINSGIAGAMGEGLGVFDFVVSEKTVYHDVDVTQFGYKLGQIPGSDAEFCADSYMIEKTQAAFLNSALSKEHKLVKGLIASGDQFISGGEKKEFIKKNFNPACVEMEGCAVAHTASLNKIPFVVIRCMSDTADDNVETVYKFTEDEAAKLSAVFVEQIVGLL